VLVLLGLSVQSIGADSLDLIRSLILPDLLSSKVKVPLQAEILLREESGVMISQRKTPADPSMLSVISSNLSVLTLLILTQTVSLSNCTSLQSLLVCAEVTAKNHPQRMLTANAELSSFFIIRI